MNLELLASILVLGISIIALIIKLWKMMPYQQITEIDQLKAAKEVLDKSSKSFDENLHPYTKEIASKVIARSDYISSRALEYLLNLENPHQCIKDFVRSINCFKPIDGKTNHVLEFAGIYRTQRCRTCLKWVGAFFTIFFVLIACIPVIIFEELIATELSARPILVFLLMPSGIYLVWESVKLNVKVVRAEILKDSAEKYERSLENNDRQTEPTIVS